MSQRLSTRMDSPHSETEGQRVRLGQGRWDKEWGHPHGPTGAIAIDSSLPLVPAEQQCLLMWSYLLLDQRSSLWMKFDLPQGRGWARLDCDILASIQVNEDQADVWVVGTNLLVGCMVEPVSDKDVDDPLLDLPASRSGEVIQVQPHHTPAPCAHSGLSAHT